jgi:hypothetical protein
LQGTISFGMNGDLTFAPGARMVRGAHTISKARELHVSGPLENPVVVVEAVGALENKP